MYAMLAWPLANGDAVVMLGLALTTMLPDMLAVQPLVVFDATTEYVPAAASRPKEMELPPPATDAT